MPCCKLCPEFLASTLTPVCPQFTYVKPGSARRFSTHDRPVTSLRGYGPTNNISNHPDNSKLPPCGIATASILTSYSPWDSNSLRPSYYWLRDLRVCWRICLLSGEKDGKCCGHTTFSDLTSTPTISQMLRSRRQTRKSMAWDQGQHNLWWLAKSLQPSNSLRVDI